MRKAGSLLAPLGRSHGRDGTVAPGAVGPSGAARLQHDASVPVLEGVGRHPSSGAIFDVRMHHPMTPETRRSGGAAVGRRWLQRGTVLVLCAVVPHERASACRGPCRRCGGLRGSYPGICGGRSTTKHCGGGSGRRAWVNGGRAQGPHRAGQADESRLFMAAELFQLVPRGRAQARGEATAEAIRQPKG